MPYTASALNGSDFNGDNVTDYALCWQVGARPGRLARKPHAAVRNALERNSLIAAGLTASSTNQTYACHSPFVLRS